MENTEKFGLRLRRMRRAHKLTQTKLAHEIGVSPHHVMDMEAGRRNPSMKLMEQIAKVFGVSVASLVDQSQSAPLISIPASASLKKYLKIPDDIIERAQAHEPSGEVWEYVRIAFDEAEAHQAQKEQKAKKNRA